MGIIVISSYKPKPGKETELLEAVKTHVPILRELGLATDRKVIAMKAKNGTILEVFEWASKQAINDAHNNPRVHKMWSEFEACCGYEILCNIEEAKTLFSEFEPLEI
jgi:quinol monooxygenase YgiN